MNTKTALEPTLKQAAQFLSLVSDKSREEVQALYTSGLFSDLLKVDPTKIDRYKFRRMLGLEPELRIITDYDTPLEQQFEATGLSLSFQKSSLEHFEKNSSGERMRECRLFDTSNWRKGDKLRFSLNDGLEKIKEADQEHPWQPADVWDAIAFEKQFPERQHQFAIIALGSHVLRRQGEKIRKLFPSLDWGWQLDGNRYNSSLQLTFPEYSTDSGDCWKSGFRLLAVRDVK